MVPEVGRTWRLKEYVGLAEVQHAGKPRGSGVGHNPLNKQGIPSWVWQKQPLFWKVLQKDGELRDSGRQDMLRGELQNPWEDTENEIRSSPARVSGVFVLFQPGLLSHRLGTAPASVHCRSRGKIGTDKVGGLPPRLQSACLHYLMRNSGGGGRETCFIT